MLVRIFPVLLGCAFFLTGCTQPAADDATPARNIYLSSIVNKSQLSGHLDRVYVGDDGYEVFESWDLAAGETKKFGPTAYWIDCHGTTFEFYYDDARPPRSGHGPSGSACTAMAGQGLEIIIMEDAKVVVAFV